MNRILLFIITLILASCASLPKQEVTMNYSQADFQAVINGKNSDLFTLKNKSGMTVTLTNYGAKIVSIFVPDKNGQMADVILGFKNIGEYQKNSASHGATVGPFANRIGNATFTIDSVTYNLPKNNGKNSLHSGPKSFYRQVWDAVQNDNSVEMSLASADGEWGFPGNKTVKVTYSLTDNNELRIDYQATTDKPTHFNLTNHSYFNLRGEGNGDILQHIAVIQSNKVTEVDSTMIPTGVIADISGTPLDFSTPFSFGERIDSDHPQLKIAKGYDFNYILDNTGSEPNFAASVFEPESGRYMEVLTTEPGIQLYTGNHLKGAETGKSGQPYGIRTGFCLETQHYPDSPNQPAFPSTLVLPGDTFRSVTIYRFSVKK